MTARLQSCRGTSVQSWRYTPEGLEVCYMLFTSKSLRPIEEGGTRASTPGRLSHR